MRHELSKRVIPVNNNRAYLFIARIFDRNRIAKLPELITVRWFRWWFICRSDAGTLQLGKSSRNPASQ